MQIHVSMYLYARVPNERGLLATYHEVCVYRGGQCLHKGLWPPYRKHIRKTMYVWKKLQNHEKLIKTHDWGLWFHAKCLATLLTGQEVHMCWDPSTAATGMQVSAALKNRPYYGQTLTAPLMLGNGPTDGGVNHWRAGGIHTLLKPT